MPPRSSSQPFQRELYSSDFLIAMIVGRLKRCRASGRARATRKEMFGEFYRSRWRFWCEKATGDWAGIRASRRQAWRDALVTGRIGGKPAPDKRSNKVTSVTWNRTQPREPA